MVVSPTHESAWLSSFRKPKQQRPLGFGAAEASFADVNADNLIVR
jgi:hypothetical protein